MLWLAAKILLQEKGRLAITLVGIVFSTVLTLVEVAIYLGMMANATGPLRHLDADIWVISKNAPNFDFAQPFPEQRINRVRALEEVQWAEKIFLGFGNIKLQDGSREQIQIIGFDPDTGIGAPWSMLQGSPTDVKGGQYIIMDQTDEPRLGKLEVGSLWEIDFMKVRTFRLVGLSKGIRSFITFPVTFVSYNEFKQSASDTDWAHRTTFVVAKLKDSATLRAVLNTLRATMPDNDVYSKGEFIHRSVMYWTVQTGLGMAFMFTAALAIIVGGAIVGQTIYAGTMEHLRDYGTMKAMGASNREINLVILSQAAISAMLGFCVGVMIVWASKAGIQSMGVPLYFHLFLFVGLFVVVLATCLAAAYVSVRKVRKLDPVIVFRM